MIAAEHCRAARAEDTNWPQIVKLYDLLADVMPSPIISLNRAVAMAEWRGPREGLALLEELSPPSWLAGWYLWAAVLADLHRRCGHTELADQFRSAAIEAAPSDAVREALQRRLTATVR